VSEPGPAFECGRTWENHHGNQSVDPLRIYAPATIEEVARIVGDAEAAAVTVRAVGSGHSWSDVALTPGFLLETKGLAQVPWPEPDFVRAEQTDRRLVRVGAGAPIKDVNAWLDDHGLALSNMGGYDHQTVAGVISTSTHGSGMSFGPLNDFVRSLDLVAGGGRIYRIEPGDGPTDAAAYARHHGDRRELVQDDDVFDAVSVGIGSMGVVCSATIEVEPRYFLREVREFHTWDKVRADLEAGDVLAHNRHYEVLFSPYERKHRYPCLVTTRNLTGDPARRRWVKRTRNLFVEALSRFPLTPSAIRLLVSLWPRLSPWMLENAIRALIKDQYDNVSYRVLNIGAANVLPAFSSEIAVPMDGRHLEAVEAIIEVAAAHRRLGEVYQSSPISLRFVKRSPAGMSMMSGRDTMMIELIQLSGIDGGYELLEAYEKRLYALGGRPHWGQVNTLAGTDRFIASMYPGYPRWLEVRRRLDPRGVFDSPFTKRVGITEDRFVAEAPA
jgi:L-gulono-1,4-lactone dehydrogenase